MYQHFISTRLQHDGKLHGGVKGMMFKGDIFKGFIGPADGLDFFPNI